MPSINRSRARTNGSRGNGAIVRGGPASKLKSKLSALAVEALLNVKLDDEREHSNSIDLQTLLNVYGISEGPCRAAHKYLIQILYISLWLVFYYNSLQPFSFLEKTMLTTYFVFMRLAKAVGRIHSPRHGSNPFQTHPHRDRKRSSSLTMTVKNQSNLKL